ncbi:MAG: NAD(+) synthase [Planctomycetes bacterium]|nr:NAD(+) synthase [Planctomycetota bacterium]
MRGFARVSAAVPSVAVADVASNREHTLALWRQSHRQGDAIVVFPELGLSGYTVRDLFLDRHLQDSCIEALLELARAGADLAPVAVVGLPLRVCGLLYNVAAVLSGGRILGLVPKAYLPNYREFEETRWFRPGTEVEPGRTVRLGDCDVPFGLDLLFCAENVEDLVLGLEICEDYWVHLPPHVAQVSAGATVIANLSASNFTIGKAELRRLLARAASDRGKCAYLYVAAGPGESSTDLAFDADAFLCENGALLVESQRFSRENQLVTLDVDLETLVRERVSTNSFGDCSREARRPFRRISFRVERTAQGALRRPVERHPFLPSDPETLATRCWEIFEIQTNALATRLDAIGNSRLVLGVSGGLDSTHAALVAAGALDILGASRKDLICVTMPGLGTSSGTRGNAFKLSEALGATFREVGISDLSLDVLKAVAHPAAAGVDDVEGLLDALRGDPSLGDVTLENAQARLRTLVLMTYANQDRALVVGTGDLSEKALGWCTYNGDHIAMYDVNCSVPKTLIQFVIRWVANSRVQSWTSGDPTALREVLFAVLDTPISPELLPADAEGQIAQLTESVIGPYELHDFFLFHLVRRGARPARILDLAQVAFGTDYSLEVLKKWLHLFLKRFFQNQFKRSCTADGPKVGTVALSPRGDWRMPSDAVVGGWLAEVVEYGTP